MRIDNKTDSFFAGGYRLIIKTSPGPRWLRRSRNRDSKGETGSILPSSGGAGGG